MKCILIAAITTALACSSGDFSGTVTYEVKPNGGDMNSPCGTIVDKEPAPGGKACCIDDKNYENFYFDGSQASSACTGGDVCHVGTCGGVWNPDTLTWQVYSKL